MANKLKTKTPPLPNPEVLNEDKEVDVTVAEVVKDERTTKIFGAVSLLIMIFLFVAIVSYLFSWQEDQDIVYKAGIKVFSTDAPKVHNMLGTLGAYVAHNLVFNGFGIASILLCTFFFVLGINLLFDKKYFSLKKNLKYISVALLLISTTLAFVAASSQLSWGGAVGNFVSNWLNSLLGKFGTGSVLFLAYFVYFIWKYNPTFKLPERKKIINDFADLNNDKSEAGFLNENGEKEFVTEGKFFVQEDKEMDIKFGEFELDENGNPITGNKLKADSKLVSVVLPDDEHIPFDVKRIYWAYDNLALTAHIDNIFDKRHFIPVQNVYEEVGVLPGRGREFSITLKASF